MSLNTYLCTKSVQAAKIVSIRLPEDPELASAGERWLGLANEELIRPADWMTKHKPEVGGYLVQYEDGYLSYSPAEAFEKGYLESPSPQPGHPSLVRELNTVAGSTKLIPAGHLYELANLGQSWVDLEYGAGNQCLRFICKEPKVGGAPGELETVMDGTTNEAVLQALINRLAVLQFKFPCEENRMTRAHLQAALEWQYMRTARRQARNVEGKALA